MSINQQPAVAPSWAPVTVTCDGRSSVAATVKASFRWWTDSGQQRQVKGLITLEKFTSVPMFRLAYTGKEVVDGSELSDINVHGALYLPIDAGRIMITQSILKSEHSKAHGIRMVIPFNRDGLQCIQLVIPTINKSATKEASTFGDCLETAEHQRVSYFGLI
jgi:hypothetical protein